MVLWPYFGSSLNLWSPHHVPDQHLRALSLQIHSLHLLDSETKFLGQILSLSYFCPTCKHFHMALKRLCKLKLNGCILFSFMFGHNYPNQLPILTLRYFQFATIVNNIPMNIFVNKSLTMYQMTFLGQLYRNKRTDIKYGTKYSIHIANLISRECADLHPHSRVSCVLWHCCQPWALLSK